MRVVHVANFYGPKSGGLRTTMHQLGLEYTRLGHEFTYIVPGATSGEEPTEFGLRVTVASPEVPGSGGYRVILNRGAVIAHLERLAPDQVEVSDRLSLRVIGRWAQRHGIRCLVIAHETLDGLARRFAPPWLPLARVVDWHNRRLARAFDAVVVTTDFAGREFRRIGIPNLVKVPLGVDLEAFTPTNFDEALHDIMARDAAFVLLHVGRLSPEKSPAMSIDALEELMRRGYDARLLIAGDGPMRAELERHAAGLPVDFLGFVADRRRLASIIASADVALAPGPLETFCLAALEALASGTQVVCSASSAVGEIVAGAGRPAADNAAAFADAVEGVLASGHRVARQAVARDRAEQFTWQRAALLMLNGRVEAMSNVETAA